MRDLGNAYSSNNENCAGTGGGGGAMNYQMSNSWEYTQNGGTGTSWYGGTGGGSRSINAIAPTTTTSGGTIVCYGSTVTGNGTVLANGTNGASQPNTIYNETLHVWQSNANAGGSGGGCVVLFNCLDESNINISVNRGGRPVALVYASTNSGYGGAGCKKTNWKTQ